MKDAFSSYHPIINFLYFLIVLLSSMLFTHPVCLLISFLCAFCWSCYLIGIKALRFHLFGMLPLFLFAAIINPAFSHEGATILTYLPSGNPFTLESVFYGIFSAGMLITVIIWFSCYHKIMTSDKFIYLFGKIMPSLSLVLSMVLRFIPKFKQQLKLVSQAQRNIGYYAANGNVLHRLQHSIRILSIMITWSLENAIETADSMKSRGYGLPNRSAFSIYEITKRDKKAFVYLCSMGILLLFFAYKGSFYFRYYPTMRGNAFSIELLLGFIIYFCICVFPLVIDFYEDMAWKNSRKKIPTSKRKEGFAID